MLPYKSPLTFSGNFIINSLDQEEEEQEEEEEKEHVRFAFEYRGGSEAAQLQQIADRYDARAAKERRAVESSIDHMGDGGVDPTLSIAALIVARD
jgi:hypothetical protein